jgi:type II secretory pathway pseudopilin PulG
MRSKSGFTLVELIVTLSIAIIIIGVTTSILISSMNLSDNTLKAAQDEQILNSCLDFVEEQLEFASGIAVSNDLTAELATSDDLLYLATDASGSSLAQNGRIFYREGTPGAQPLDAFGTDFYTTKNVSLVVTQTNKSGQRPGLTITVILHSSNGSERARLTRSLPLINAAPSESDGVIEYNSQAAAELLVIKPFGYVLPDSVDLDGNAASELTWTVPTTGDYRIETWGANSGQLAPPTINAVSQNGFGGYAAGTVHLTKGTVLYLKAGGAGEARTDAQYYNKGGFNGGGDGYNNSSSQNGASGGGASDVRVLQDDLNHRIIVAGGGGGISTGNATTEGGNGGGESGVGGKKDGKATGCGTGGSQSKGGTNSQSQQIAAAFGTGGGYSSGSQTSWGAGGGGGWYGGGNGAGGGGGSGYVLSSASIKPAGYFNENGSYYFAAGDIVNVSPGDSQFKAKPAEGNNGYVRIALIG